MKKSLLVMLLVVPFLILGAASAQQPVGFTSNQVATNVPSTGPTKLGTSNDPFGIESKPDDPLGLQPLSPNAIHPPPKHLTAEEFLDAPDILPQSVVEETKAKAEKGDAAAQNNLGLLYGNGQGVEQDYAEAIKWFRKAADQGCALAQYNLGVGYANGQGVTTNYTEAVKWFRKAAEQGDATAQYNLGVCYENGYGVPEDLVEAAKWYHKAADQGYAVAQFALAKCYYFGAGVTLDKSEAVKWFRKIAERGDAEAQYSLGACYANGDGVPKDIVEAYKWMNLAAAQGYEPAKKYLSTDFEIVTTPAQTAAGQRPQPYQRGLQLPPVENQSQEDVALQLRLAESNRRFAQFMAQQRQQQALDDIAYELRQQRFQQEFEASQRRLDSIRSSLDVVTPPLGNTVNSYDPNSLANPYGAGSPYKSDGLMNPYSQYGSPYSSKSWRNPYATDTPKLYDSQGNYAGKLSSNPYDPDSTANPYGRYGSPYSPNSVNNPYGLGSPYNTTPIYVVPSP